MRITEIELEELGFKSLGICGFMFERGGLIIEVGDYKFYQRKEYDNWDELKYVHQVKKLINSLKRRNKP